MQRFTHTRLRRKSAEIVPIIERWDNSLRTSCYENVYAMILTVAAFKGGVAKTTTAVHLAAFLAERGPTVLIDGDPNRSATGWKERGGESGLPFPVVDVRQLAKVARQYTHLVIDTEARPATADLKELAEGGDFLVIPTTPDALALEATVQTVEQLQGFGAKAFAVLLTIVPPRPSRVGDEATAFLTESGIRVLSSRVSRLMAFQNAAAAGVPVSKVKDENARRAWEEYRQAAEEIATAVEESQASQSAHRSTAHDDRPVAP